MSPPGPVVVLVDAYTSGQYLPPEFAALGAELVHVQSTAELMPSMPAPDLSVYRENIVHEDLVKTVAQLAPYRPVCVMAGQEPGVLLADELAGELGLPANTASLSAARRDKYQMIETLRAAGLHCAGQFKSGDVAALADWAGRNGYPVVVKPLRSAAGDGVFVCATDGEVRAAAAAVLASDTIYGEGNAEALVQSYLHGPEYVVDMVSYEGRRYLCGVWQYHKRLLASGRNIYDREHLLHPDEEPVPQLAAYVEQALDALGVRYGPSHAEVIMTPDGPALVEVGCRIAGNMHPGFHDRCAGGNQAGLTALAWLRPGRFLRDHAGRRYGKRCEAVCCTTSTTLDGVVDHIGRDAVEQIAALETVHRFDLKLAPGDRIRPTVDLYSSTMRIFMCGADMAAIDRDYQRIGVLKDRVYRISESG
ncbi:ATP-grasp domain-containing protein [Catellatospora bangladeshensis]|uniref:ATP-grasp domain-containing protein n=2 Tax=Catellatospora bangladeshensis TaxID=310355 RepID=A0A8J3JGU3_9ACTN|nr:ATP-grasp domain-containing protein [Catellatospora bangladeshensis]GIF84336.1 ATP-grasp domain-containing protein [Catellatospora bangladeshensis]